MIRLKTILFLAITLFMAANVTGQEQKIRLLNGKVYFSPKVNIDDTLQQVYYRTTKGHLHVVDFEEVYSVSVADSTLRFFYQPDSLSNKLSVEGMDYFLQGSALALAQKKPWGYFAGGAAVGAGSVFLMPALGLPTVGAPVFSALVGGGGTQLPLKSPTFDNTELLANPNFQSGYNEAAKKRRNRFMFMGLGVGLAASIIFNLSAR